MKLEIIGQQEGVPVPSWYRVHTPCPNCGAQDIPWTVTRYGQSSYDKKDQTGTSRQVGGFGAGFHMNRFTLKCRCGFEAELDEATPEELRQERFKVKVEKVTLAGHKVPNAQEQHQRSWPNLSFGRRPSIIDGYHKALIPQLIAMLKALNNDGNYQYSYRQIAEFVNERVKKSIMPDEALIDESVVKRFARKNRLNRAKERE